MLQKPLFLLIICALFFSCNTKPKKQNNNNILSESEIAEGWQLLFDGKTTNGWKIFKGGEVDAWTIKDGILYNSGVGSDHGGDIITTAQFENFELSLEWRIDTASNSGIFYLVQEGAGDAIYQSGSEYQLLDDKGWPTKLAPAQYSGANYDMHAPKGAVVKPLDKWNKTLIVKKDSLVEHWLNEVKVVEYKLWDKDWLETKNNSKWKDEPEYGIFPKGHIGLQDHGGLTMFRNIKIRPL